MCLLLTFAVTHVISLLLLCRQNPQNPHALPVDLSTLVDLACGSFVTSQLPYKRADGQCELKCLATRQLSINQASIQHPLRYAACFNFRVLKSYGIHTTSILHLCKCPASMQASKLHANVGSCYREPHYVNSLAPQYSHTHAYQCKYATIPP